MNNELNNFQKKSKNGGARPGAGRKKGTTNKISGSTILDAVKKQTGKNFETLLAQGYHDAIMANDKPTRLQYEKMFLSKVVADKTEMDITSGGEQIKAIFNFPNVELSDWK